MGACGRGYFAELETSVWLVRKDCLLRRLGYSIKNKKKIQKTRVLD
jgi:hypothetical protein